MLYLGWCVQFGMRGLRPRKRIGLGKGGHKRHSAVLMLRVCYERKKRTRYSAPRAKARGKRSRPSGPLTSSTRSIADSVGAAHGQVQRNREAVAQLYDDAQARLIAEVLAPSQPHKYLIYKLRFDETHFDVAADTGDGFETTDCASFPTVICKACLVWLPRAETDGHGAAPIEREEPITVAPAILPCPADAEALWSALKAKLPFWVDDQRLQTCADHVMFTCGHDAHRANPRFLRALETVLRDCNIPWTLISSRCTMHQVQIVYRLVYERLAFHDSLFCLGHLLRIGKNIRAVRRHLHAIIKEKFRVRYVHADSWGEPHPTMRLLLDTCFVCPSPVAPTMQEDDDSGDDEAEIAKRRVVQKEFEIMFSSDPFSDDIYHNCNLFRCSCKNAAGALKRALSVADQVILPTMLPIIALNKWTGYQRPGKMVSVACVFNILPLAWSRSRSTSHPDDEASISDYVFGVLFNFQSEAAMLFHKNKSNIRLCLCFL